MRGKRERERRENRRGGFLRLWCPAPAPATRVARRARDFACISAARDLCGCPEWGLVERCK
eukprot:6418739-Prymnesium_polylepis.1